MTVRKVLLAATVMTALAGCRTQGEIVVDTGVGISALRSVCPSVGVPDFTGNVTLFNPVSARTADALDVTAAITNLRSSCDDTGAQVRTAATFDVIALRRDTRGARRIELPYFSTVVRGGNVVVAKRLGTVTLEFADGEARAQGSGAASSSVDRNEATLSEDIRRRITERRRAGQQSAAVDPLSEPDVRAAVARATFELLVGFQLNDEQLEFNATL